MKRVWIVNIGNELLGRGVINSNGEWMAAKFESKGWEIAEIRIIADGFEALKEAWETKPQNVDCVVFSGGLGPTSDDTTRFDVAKLMDVEVELNEELYVGIKKAMGAERFLQYKEVNEVQAKLPKSAISINNPVGTACGFKVIHEGIDLFFTPGVPFEMKEMLSEGILPLLESGIVSLKKELISFGIGESLQTELLKNIDFEPPFSFASLPGPRGLRLRLAIFENDPARLEHKWNQILEALSPYKQNIISAEGENLVDVVSGFLIKNEIKIAVAESCTAGMLGSILTEASGSSDFFEGGVISYSNSIKQKVLGVNGGTLIAEGAVSELVSMEMSIGVAKLLYCGASIAITGVAGPGGGTPEKPVGTVWVSVCYKGEVFAKKFVLRGDRERVRVRSCYEALNLFREKFIN